MHHGREVNFLHAQGQLRGLGFIAALGQFVGVVKDITANEHQNNHEDKADVKVRARVAEMVENVFLDHDTDLDPDNSGYSHSQAQLDIGLAVLITLVGTDHSLGELVAHVARNRNCTGRTE